jgi:prepilin-type N-terminal cleavage/methylation domain-containing protein
MQFRSTGTRGFTLIELLVVIAVIGLLASVIMVSLNSARAKARDARRKEDLKQISLALEMYYNEYGGYPSGAWPNVDFRITASLALEPKMLQFIPSFAKDPSGADTCYNNAYLYLSNVYDDGSGNNAKATSYSLYATLEDQSTSNLDADGADGWLASGANACAGSQRPNYKVGTYK